MKERQKFLLIITVFLVFYFLPVNNERVIQGIISALELTRWYARKHILLCLVPAFFIAGAMSVFVSQQSVMRYLGA